jgi:hypothetical protein
MMEEALAMYWNTGICLSLLNSPALFTCRSSSLTLASSPAMRFPLMLGQCSYGYTNISTLCRLEGALEALLDYPQAYNRLVHSLGQYERLVARLRQVGPGCEAISNSPPV